VDPLRHAAACAAGLSCLYCTNAILPRTSLQFMGCTAGFCYLYQVIYLYGWFLYHPFLFHLLRLKTALQPERR